MKKALFRVLLVGIFFLNGFAGTAGASGSEPFIVGKARVTAMRDMAGEMKLEIFRGADEAAMRALVPSGATPAGVHVFLVQIGDKNILIDTGYGLNAPDRKSGLPELLRRNGLAPEDIALVLLTHMHGDHIGGLIPGGKAFFPKAEVLVSAKELDFWTSPETLRKNPGRAENIRKVFDVREIYGEKLKTFAFETDTPVAPGITALAAPGHTPGHAMFFLSSGDGKMLFWGDLVHGAALQFARPEICATYDMDMEEAVATRRAVFDKAVKENLPVAGAHLPFPAIGTVSAGKDGNAYVFKPGL